MQEEKWDSLSEKHFGDTGQSFDKRSDEDIERFLSDYLGRPIKLLAAIKETNVATGYPVWNFKIRYEDESQSDEDNK